MHKYKFKNENIQLSQEREVHTQLNKNKIKLINKKN